MDESYRVELALIGRARTPTNSLMDVTKAIAFGQG